MTAKNFKKTFQDERANLPKTIKDESQKAVDNAFLRQKKSLNPHNKIYKNAIYNFWDLLYYRLSKAFKFLVFIFGFFAACRVIFFDKYVEIGLTILFAFAVFIFGFTLMHFLIVHLYERAKNKNKNNNQS